ncbi:sugar ABC transporter ATP-binding protein [Enterovibrio norvegicus]|uniref:Sugar ABC transporter ATP-binding protein n=1 Tax=Enterovibrio norvegicus TaxID=188144 RepID=A0A2N7LFW0_9GAMM|nr:sugar ABC transporter ATP-binding protein [Enterovibrio norvegicus]PMN72212.1 sugar ABC transporter ATP-binding protein [Enterovibrio norvegicus]PMN94425.1 sugar ABC transporter ATP-binding protein [Enterovibrio norvegicus]
MGELLRLEHVSKQYPGVLALDDVSLTLEPGEVHVLFGENGAGKSTLISMVAGVMPPSNGQLIFNGEPVRFNSVYDARLNGISAVFQEFSLVESLTVGENLLLGDEPTNWRFIDQKTSQELVEKELEKFDFDLSPTQVVGQLSRAGQQMVEIAKALRSDVSVLILDEPTASLTEKETEQLFELVDELKAKGVGIFYITHRMAEIHRIADRISVLRDGKHIGTVNAEEVTDDELVEMMTGRVISQLYPDIPCNRRETVLQVSELQTSDGTVQSATFSVAEGEVVGFAGLVGCGKSEALRACFGIETVESGQVTFYGENVTGFSPREMLEMGMFYNSRDRKEEGLMMVRSGRENIGLASLDTPPFKASGSLVNRRHEKDIAERLASRLRLYPMDTERDVSQFSGGNQQKVLLAKCLTRGVSLYIFDEPTVGVDVATRSEIYAFIGELCEQGAAVVIISSDLPEILNLTHRAYVMHEGEIKAHFTGDDITEQNILGHFFHREETESAAS